MSAAQALVDPTPVSDLPFFYDNKSFGWAYGCLAKEYIFPATLAARSGHVTRFWPAGGELKGLTFRALLPLPLPLAGLQM